MAAKAAMAAIGVTAETATVKSEIEKAQSQKRQLGLEQARKNILDRNAAKKQRQSVKLRAGVTTTIENA